MLTLSIAMRGLVVAGDRVGPGKTVIVNGATGQIGSCCSNTH